MKHSRDKRERPLNSKMSQNDDEAILVLKRGPTDGFATETCGCLYPKVHNNLLGVLSHATDIEMKFSRASLAFAPFFGVTTSRSHRRLTAMDYVHFTNEPIAPCAYMPDYFLASIDALRTQEP